VIADDPAPVPGVVLRGLTLGLPRGTFLTDGVDAAVGNAFDRALARLSAAGVRLTLFDFPELAELPSLNANGGFAAVEAWTWHRALIARAGDRYDPMVRGRIERGAAIGAADHRDLIAARARLVASAAARTAAFDALLCPTVPIAPPALADIADAREYNRLNLLLLRNPAPFNFLDRCAISLPMHRAGEAPAGLMLVGEAMADKRLFGLAAAVEAVVSAESHPPA
jgi:aspartyl-tRNA(Asn)/glutamyl-tRNA(Gln) amidotransferase subunit A